MLFALSAAAESPFVLPGEAAPRLIDQPRLGVGEGLVVLDLGRIGVHLNQVSKGAPVLLDASTRVDGFTPSCVGQVKDHDSMVARCGTSLEGYDCQLSDPP